MKITYEKLIKDSKKLAEEIIKTERKYEGVFGVATGGILPAYVVAEELGLPLVNKIDEGILIVDDLIDSGETLKEFKNDTAVLYRKKHSPLTTYFVEEINEWIELPHEKVGGEAVEINIIRLLEFYNQEPSEGSIQRLSNILESIYK